jgi:hypothetical protein
MGRADVAIAAPSLTHVSPYIYIPHLIALIFKLLQKGTEKNDDP